MSKMDQRNWLCRAVCVGTSLCLAHAAVGSSTVIVDNFGPFNTGTVSGQGAAQAWQPSGTVPGVPGTVTPTAWRSSDPNAPHYNSGVGDDFDQEVVDVTSGGATNRYWRLSNSYTTSGFSNLPWVAASAVAGESGSKTWSGSDINGGVLASTTNQFSSTFHFQSATGAAQNGLRVDVSAGQFQTSSRNSFLRIDDTGAGFDLVFYETGVNGTFSNSTTTIATGLSYTDIHKIEMNIEFVDGLNWSGDVGDSDFTGNDIVTIKLNDSVIHTGTTWESYWYSLDETESHAVNGMVFRPRQSDGDYEGGGLLFGLPQATPVPASAVSALGGLGLASVHRRRRR